MDLKEIGRGVVDRDIWRRRGTACRLCETVTNVPVSKSAGIG